MQVIPFAANFEVAASVRCSPKIISLGNFTHTVCYAFYWFAFFLNFFVILFVLFFFWLDSTGLDSFASGEQDISWQRIWLVSCRGVAVENV